MDCLQIIQSLFDAESGDITIKLANNCKKRVHKEILEYHSDVLKSLLNGKKREIAITHFPQDHIIFWLRLLYGFWDYEENDGNLDFRQTFNILWICDFYNTKLVTDKLIELIKSRINNDNIEEVAKLCQDHPHISVDIRQFILEKFESSLDKFSLITKIEDFEGCEEQFTDYCYDLISPRKYPDKILPLIYCCKHKDKKKSFLGDLEKQKDIYSFDQSKCCISRSVLTNGNSVCTIFCCLHRTCDIPAKRKQYIDNLFKEFIFKKKIHNILKGFNQELTMD